jgi:chemotaxis signal transduction protein
MIFENADEQGEMYLAFSAGRLEYVLPLSEVARVAAEVPEEMQSISLPGSGAGRNCAVIFRDGQGLSALYAEKVTGIVQIPGRSQFEVPAEVRTSRNSWIAGTAWLKTTDSLCYLLDCAKLGERFFGDET